MDRIVKARVMLGIKLPKMNCQYCNKPCVSEIYVKQYGICVWSCCENHAVLGAKTLTEKWALQDQMRKEKIMRK